MPHRRGHSKDPRRELKPKVRNLQGAGGGFIWGPRRRKSQGKRASYPDQYEGREWVSALWHPGEPEGFKAGHRPC